MPRRRSRKFSQKDAAKYPEFQVIARQNGQGDRRSAHTGAAEHRHPSSGDLVGHAQTGRVVRKLGKRTCIACCAGDRWRSPIWSPNISIPNCFAPPSRLAASFGTFLGPWSAGSSLVLLIRAAGDEQPAGSAYVRHGRHGRRHPGDGLSGQQAGAEIRSGAEVIEVRVKDGVGGGVVLSTGEEISAKAMISNADPKRTLLKLVDPVATLARFRDEACSTTACRGRWPRSTSPFRDFRSLRLLKGEERYQLLSGRIHIGPEIDYLERAFDESKYGNFSKQPYLEIAIPSVTDPSLAPAGKHVMSIYMQYAPYKLKGSDWESQRVALGDTVVKTLAQYAPKLPELILTHQIITPQDLEETYGLTGGHIFHGELALDQFFTMRPLLDWARYRTPIQNLYLCGSGTHPGAGLTGGSGANAAREILKDLKK